MSEPAEGVTASAEIKKLNVRQAAFIGVGSMVGAGIFALLGAAEEVAGHFISRAGHVQVAHSPMEQR